MDIERVINTTYIAQAEHHAALDSTNDRAAELAGRDDVALPLLIVADRQTAGRGRGANRWWTGPGSLALSLLIEPPEAVPGGRPSPLLGLAAGVAVVCAVAPLLPEWPLGIHWPNDVMLGERKLAGVLVEVLANGRAVIGIGLNTNNTAGDAPEELHRRVATLRDATGREHDQTDVLIALLGALEFALRALADAPEQIAAEADRFCLQRGQVLRLRLGQETIEGRCDGIARDGALLLDTSGGPRVFHTATIDL